jgi:type I restriction enzyme M protein
LLYVAAATLRNEAWRFDYGRKMTPKRIAEFPLSADKNLLAWIKNENAHAENLEALALNAAGAVLETEMEDREDAEIATRVLQEIDSGVTALVYGAALKQRLGKMLN